MVATFALVASAPLITIAVVLVKLTSPGPAFFRQKRIGQNGEPFILVKLRTMSAAKPGSMVTSANDPRITTIGRWLRRTKIDELPSFWNVIRGDMALVGPRPEVPNYVDLDCSKWKEILSVRPGLADPVTAQLRNEQELLSQVENTDDFYREVLQPYKLDGYLKFVRGKDVRNDLLVLYHTTRAAVLPGSAAPPTLEELRSGKDAASPQLVYEACSR